MQVAEGVTTAGVVVALAARFRVFLPVLTAVAQVRQVAEQQVLHVWEVKLCALRCSFGSVSRDVLQWGWAVQAMVVQE